MRAQTANATTMPIEPLNRENNDMMAGSAIYARIQAKPKKSAATYVVPAVVVVALGAGALFYALKPVPNHAATPPAAVAQQQADTSAQQAAVSANAAQSSARAAMATSDDAQAKTVAQTGQPPAVSQTHAVRTQASTPVMHKAPARMTVGTRPAPPSSAAAAGIDASTLSPPPAPVTATPPAETTVQPAPVNPPATTDAAPPQPAPQEATPAPTPN